MPRKCANPGSGVLEPDRVTVTATALVLLVLAVGGALALHAPVLALPLVIMILFVWGGQRVATARDRAG